MARWGVAERSARWFGGALKNGYRTRAVLQPSRSADGKWHLRFGQTPLFEGVCVSDCQNQSPGLRRLIPQILSAFSNQQAPYWPEMREGSIRHLIVETDGTAAENQARVIVSTHGPMHEPSMSAFADRLFQTCGVEVYGDALPKRNAGLYAKPRLLTPSTRMRHHAGEHPFSVSPKSWWSQSPSSITIVSEQAARLANLRPSDRVLEVGCGVGTLGVLIGGAVTAWCGIDRERSAIADARRNSDGKGEHYTFYVGDGEHWLRKLVTRPGPDVLFLHGMRQRFGDSFMRLAATMAPRTIIYIAPNPNALFEDVLSLPHYELSEVGLIDNTPNSGHWLTMARLTKGLAERTRRD